MTTQLITASYTDEITISFTSSAWFNATNVAKNFGKQAKEWLRLDSTIQYIDKLVEIQKRENPTFDKNQLISIKKGAPENGGGTWLHPKLAVPFARWLEVGFSIWCDMQIDKILRRNQPTTQPHYVTKEEREPLVKAIRSLVKSYQSKGMELSYADAHRIVNYRLGVDGIDHMTPEQLTQGVAIVGELLQALVLEHTSQKAISKTGFIKPVVESSSNIDEFRLEFSACYKSFLWNFGENVVMVLEKDNDQLVDHARKACSPYHPRKEIEAIRKQLAIWSKMVDDSELLCGAAMDYALAHR